MFIFYNCDQLILEASEELKKFLLDFLSSTNPSVKVILTMAEVGDFSIAKKTVVVPKLSKEEGLFVLDNMIEESSLSIEVNEELFPSGLTFVQVREMFHWLKSGKTMEEVRPLLSRIN